MRNIRRICGLMARGGQGAVLRGLAASSTAEAVARAVRVNCTYEPNPKLQAQYAEKAAVYAEVYPALAALNRKL